MIRPIETATVSRSRSPSDDGVSAGDTEASSPSSSAMPSMRMAWYGSDTSTTPVMPVLAQEPGGGGERLPGAVARRLPLDGVAGHAERLEVGGPGAGLGEAVAGLAAAGDDDERRHAGLVELGGVVEPPGEHRRGLAVVLRGAEHDDGVGRPWRRRGSTPATPGRR